MLSKRKREEQINRAFGHDLAPEVLLHDLQRHRLGDTAYASVAPATWGLQLCKLRDSPHLPAIFNALRAQNTEWATRILAASLAQAAEDGHVELVKAILAVQAPHQPMQVWSPTRWARYSALRVAAANGRKDCFEVLRGSLGKYVDKKEESLLRAILKMNTLEVF